MLHVPVRLPQSDEGVKIYHRPGMCTVACPLCEPLSFVRAAVLSVASDGMCVAGVLRTGGWLSFDGGTPQITPYMLFVPTDMVDDAHSLHRIADGT